MKCPIHDAIFASQAQGWREEAGKAYHTHLKGLAVHLLAEESITTRCLVCESQDHFFLHPISLENFRVIRKQMK